MSSVLTPIWDQLVLSLLTNYIKDQPWKVWIRDGNGVGLVPVRVSPNPLGLKFILSKLDPTCDGSLICAKPIPFGWVKSGLKLKTFKIYKNIYVW